MVFHFHVPNVNDFLGFRRYLKNGWWGALNVVSGEIFN